MSTPPDAVTAPIVPDPTRGHDDLDVAAVTEIVDRAARDAEFSGVLRIERGDEPVLELVRGVATRRWGVPVHAGTRFDIASVTKLFTTVAVLQAVDGGLIDLDASLGGYVDLTDTLIPPAVTIRHLLTHTSGIADDADEEADESYEALWHTRPSYMVTTTADFLPGFVRRAPNFAPGAGVRYNNAGFVLAGLALERVTGLTYREYVREHVFARAGMTSSGFFHMREAVPDVAEGWDPVRDGDDGPITGWRQNVYSYPPIGSPDGGAHVTASDLVTFLRALRAGELMSAESTRLMLTPVVWHAGDSAWYGYGVEFRTFGKASAPDGADGTAVVRSLGKDGVNAGASAIVRYYPARDATLVMLSNMEDGIWGPYGAIDDILSG